MRHGLIYKQSFYYIKHSLLIIVDYNNIQNQIMNTNNPIKQKLKSVQFTLLSNFVRKMYGGVEECPPHIRKHEYGRRLAGSMTLRPFYHHSDIQYRLIPSYMQSLTPEKV